MIAGDGTRVPVVWSVLGEHSSRSPQGLQRHEFENRSINASAANFPPALIRCKPISLLVVLVEPSVPHRTRTAISISASSAVQQHVLLVNGRRFVYQCFRKPRCTFKCYVTCPSTDSFRAQLLHMPVEAPVSRRDLIVAMDHYHMVMFQHTTLIICRNLDHHYLQCH